MKDFKYSTVKLIEGVKEHPCLWNKKLESFRDRVERRAAWEDICSNMEEGFNEFSFEEKRVTEELLITKWTNVRDTFLKTLKTKNGKKKKRYVYHKHLSFLIPLLAEKELIHYPYPSSDEESIDDSVQKKRKRDEKEETELIQIKTRQIKPEVLENKVNSDSDHDPFDSIDNDVSMRVMNEDEAFFASLLPTVVNYTEDERLEFRIQVLDVMKRIRQNKEAYK